MWQLFSALPLDNMGMDTSSFQPFLTAWSQMYPILSKMFKEMQGKHK